MSKSMLTGLIAGVGVATAGGVAGYAWLGQDQSLDADGSAVVIEDTMEGTGTQVASTVEERAAPPAAAPARAPAPAVTRPASSAPQPVAEVIPEPAVEEECWDEEVTVQVDPTDEHAIAGTAAGAVIGGALAKKVGDDNDLATAAGAAAGAFFGRRAQKRRQENNTTTTIERRCAPVGTR